MLKRVFCVVLLLLAVSAHADVTFCDGANVSKNLDVTTTDTAVKATQGYLCGWHLFNAAAATRYFKFYNATSANVTVGTTTPVLTVPIPAGAAANVAWPNGILFTTAITVACTTGLADNNSGAPTANDCVADIFFK